MDRIRVEHPPQRPPRTSALRLLGLSSQPSSEANPLELNESDVVWSSFSNDNNSNGNYVAVESTSPSSLSISSTASESPTFHHPDRQFGQQKYGLSAVLADEHPPLVRRKASVTTSPSIGMTTAVRTIPRSSPSSDGSIGSAPGRFNMSAPVNIPVWHKMRSRSRFEEAEEEEEEEDEAVDGEMLPPHEVVAARSQTMTFSVFEGVGRTLKGRDLRRVRNAVFQQTGFLD
ncbi:hypothetical protein QQ045_004833 [Rhodiola kirilowii]